MAKKTKKAPKKPQETPKAPPAPKPYRDRKALKAAHQGALEAMQETADEYGADEVPERLINRAAAILLAPTLEEAHRVAKRTQDAMLIHVLALWARGRIPGKMSELAVEKRVKKALNLASWLDEKGLADQAESQRARAARIQQDWSDYLAVQ